MGVSEAPKPSIIKLELEDLSDIVLLASSLPLPILNYSVSSRAYFLLASAVGGAIIVYFVKDADKPAGRYVHVDKISGKYSFGNTLSLEPNHVSVLVLRVREQGLVEL